MIADSFDRRRLLLLTQSLAACLSGALGVLAWTGAATEWMVIAFAAGLGVVTAVSNPTQMALVGSLVPREDIAQAVALNSMTFNLARAFGPAAAAGVIAAFGVAPAFLVNAGSFLVFVAALRIVSPTPVERAHPSSILESVSMLRAQPRLAGHLAIVMAVGVAVDPVNTESPAFAHAFGYPPVWSGAIVGCFGLGAVAAALLLAGRMTGSRRTAGARLAVLGAGMVLFGESPWFPLGLVFLLVAGFGYLGANAAATAQLQLGVHESQRGRIMALWSVAFLGSRPLASLCDGALANWAGVRVAAPVMALPVLVGGAALLRRRAASAAAAPPLA
jgi:MFS family permease